ncbi:hypothetical protein [Methanomassiliicoccus luminyensis]|uniref:hypothetical protein n=1 Tax=Methanomassiliicoccus luminyensis TaxID=1080712 RepID=UPI0011CC1759|nr:hypothetical protein [Methanomassiliicoccus luminyensis]
MELLGADLSIWALGLVHLLLFSFRPPGRRKISKEARKGRTLKGAPDPSERDVKRGKTSGFLCKKIEKKEVKNKRLE